MKLNKFTIPPLFSVLIIIMMMITACKKSINLNDSLTSVPNDATSLIAINLKSLSTKITWDSLQSLNWGTRAGMKDNLFKKDTNLIQILKDPKLSGIDAEKNIYIVTNYSDSLNGLGKRKTFITLKDPKAFEALILKLAGPAISKEAYKQTNNGIASNNGIAASWNDKMAIIGTTDSAIPIGGSSWARYFNLKPNQSLAYHPDAVKLLSEQHDIYTFFSSAELLSNPVFKIAAAAINIPPQALTENTITTHTDFQPGKINTKTNLNIAKDIRNQFGLMFKDHPTTDLSKYLGARPIGFASSIALDSRGIKEIINANPALSVYTHRFDSLGIHPEEVLKAFDGDAFIAAYPPADTGNWGLTLGFKVRDKPDMMTFIQSITKGGIVQKINDDNYQIELPEVNWKGIGAGGMFKIIFIDDMLLMGDAPEMDRIVVERIHKSARLEDAEILQSLNKNIFGIYSNLPNLPFLPKAYQLLPTNFHFVQNGKEGEGVAIMKDPKSNPLQAFLQFFNERQYPKKK